MPRLDQRFLFCLSQALHGVRDKKGPKSKTNSWPQLVFPFSVYARANKLGKRNALEGGWKQGKEILWWSDKARLGSFLSNFSAQRVEERKRSESGEDQLDQQERKKWWGGGEWLPAC